MLSRRAKSALALATFPVLTGIYGRSREHHWTPDDTVAGGGGGGTDKPDKKAAATKLELTPEELEAKISAAAAAAVKAAEDKHKADAEKAKTDAEKEAARKQGEFKKLYDDEVELRKRDVGERDEKIRQLEIEKRVSRYIGEHHKEYAGAVDDIMPRVKIAPDAKETDIDKAIKAAVDDFVSNWKPAGSTGQGAPGKTSHGKLPAGSPAPVRDRGNDDGDRKTHGGRWSHLNTQV
jgi:hypothetical protein